MLVRSPLVDVLRAGYGIRNAQTVSEHCGSQSKIWKLQVEDQHLGLRRTRRLADERLFSYGRLARLLKDNGIRLTCPVETVDGELFFRYAGDSYVLCNWVDGLIVRDRELAIEDARFLGESLARVHQVLAGFDEPLPLPRRDYPSDAGTLNDIKRLITVIDSKGEITEYDRAVHGNLTYRCTVLEGREEADRLAPLYDERQLVHGDFNRGNILYTSEGRFAGLIDLDTFHYAPRIWDIVKACMFTLNADSDCCIQFLSGYHRVNPLRPTEIDAFHPLAMDYMVKNTWGHQEYLLNGNLHAELNDTMQHYELLVKEEPAYRNLSSKIIPV